MLIRLAEITVIPQGISILRIFFSSHTLTTRRGILMDVEIQCPVLCLQHIQRMVIQMTDFKVLKQDTDAVHLFQ